MLDAVWSLARTMGTSEGDEDLLLPLCRVAVEELTARLRPGLKPEDCGSAFPVAAALIALEGLDVMGGGVDYFSAGDLTVRGDGRGRMRLRAEEMMSPYLRERGFAFQGVLG